MNKEIENLIGNYGYDYEGNESGDPISREHAELADPIFERVKHLKPWVYVGCEGEIIIEPNKGFIEITSKPQIYSETSGLCLGWGFSLADNKSDDKFFTLMDAEGNLLEDNLNALIANL